jgi:hypothetical protein
MIGEIDIAGIFISPLLLCMVIGFAVRIMLSRLLEAAGFYRLVWQRPLFDTSLLLILTGAAFIVLRLVTHS